MSELLRPIIAGNWKMYKGPQAALAFFQQFEAAYPARAERSVVFFPPAIALAASIGAARQRSDITFGAQNIHWEDEGAFTGETSAAQVREAGGRHALIGHSERRHVFAETDDEVRRKVAAAVRNALTPFICVGETLEQRKAGQVAAVILGQLNAALDGLPADYAGQLVIAYEPVWAIGTGVTATPQDASEAHQILQGRLAERVPGRSVPILYGGSVKPDNAQSLLGSPAVDGLLVGGASLDPAGFARIAGAG